MGVSSTSYEAFRDAIGFKESSDNYSCVNSLGFVGRYQFGLARLCDLGLCVRVPGTTGFANHEFTWLEPFTQENFLGTPQLQDAVFDNHISLLRATVQKDYGSFINTTIMGQTLTMAGAVAVCHLLGIGGLQDLIRKNQDDADADGTKATTYILLFGGYDLSGLPARWSSTQLLAFLARTPASTPVSSRQSWWSRVCKIAKGLF